MTGAILAITLTNPAGYYVWIALAMIVLGISKGGFGGGGIGVLSMPMLIQALGAKDALAVMGIVLVVVDLFANLHYVGQYEWRMLKWLIPGAVIGVGVGLLILWGVRAADPHAFEREVKLIIGVICLIVVGMQLWRLGGGKIATLPTGPASSLTVGCIAAATSTVAHAAGPIVTLYVLQERIDKRRLVGTMLMYTLLINMVKLGGYAYVGIVTFATVKQSLWMLPVLPIGTVAGAWMHKRLPERPFLIIMYAAAALACGQLVHSAFK